MPTAWSCRPRRPTGFPIALSDAEAAAVPVTYLTAAIALYRMAALTSGETVLVHNAGGGLGIAATQLARLRRATVIGTASAAKHDALRSFGVEHAIDYRHADVEAEVKRITRGRGVDVDPRSDRRRAASAPATGCWRRSAGWSCSASRRWPASSAAAGGCCDRWWAMQRSTRCR